MIVSTGTTVFVTDVVPVSYIAYRYVNTPTVREGERNIVRKSERDRDEQREIRNEIHSGVTHYFPACKTMSSLVKVWNANIQAPVPSSQLLHHFTW